MKVKSPYEKWFENVDIQDKQALDVFTKEATKEAYQAIDCLACGQCCRTTVTTFREDDIVKASKFLGTSVKYFKNKYLFLDLDNTYTTQNVPCPFLNLEDNKCNIYEVRPLSCRSFPHTDRDYFLNRKKVHLANSKFCGISTYVLDQLIKEF